MSELKDIAPYHDSDMSQPLLELHHPGDDPSRAKSLYDRAFSLYDRFYEKGEIADLDEALALNKEALSLRPEGHPDRILSLSEVATCLHARFNLLGVPSDLEEALTYGHDALELRPEGHPDRAHSLSNLSNYVYARFKQFGILSDLEEALALERNALEYRPKGDPERAVSLGNLAWYYYARFTRFGALSDLDESLTLEREALELRPHGNPYRFASLGNMSNYLHSRYKQCGTLSDLDEALTLQRHALELRSAGHPDRAFLFSNLASSLMTRFNRLGVMSDLDEALALERSALDLRPQGHPGRAAVLQSIASCLFSRFTQLGTLSDLDEALALQHDALELLPEGHPTRATSLSLIAACLYTRFSQLGVISDLNEAISHQRNALELILPNPIRAIPLNNMATYLQARFSTLGTLSDLDEAISLECDALNFWPQGDPDRPITLGNAADLFYARFRQVGSIADLDGAITLAKDALELLPQGHLHRPVSLANIAFYLNARFTRLGRSSDLDEALVLERSALELRPNGHPERAQSLGHLAHRHLVRFRNSSMHDTADLRESFGMYSQLAELPQAASFTTLEWVKEWIQAAEEFEDITMVLAYQTFSRLGVHYFATLPSLPQHLALLKQLVTSTAVNAFSACLRHGNSSNAVELLEQGRGVFWGQLLRLRSPLDDVMASGAAGKDLAKKFTQLTSLLRTVLDPPPNAQSQQASQQERAFSLQIQLQGVIADIHKLPCLSHFLQPRLFSELRTAADGGPVIIVNASQYSCDALIVLSTQDPIHISLPITKLRVSQLSLELRALLARAKFRDAARDLVAFLRELWDAVVFPIVKTLEKFCLHRSRIWWCPTAEFSLLPLHAAGTYRKGQPNLSRLYISSYTPTLTALVRSRSRVSMDTPAEPHNFLIVGQSQALGHNKLVSVNNELSSVSRHVGPVSVLTRVQDQDANIIAVAEELKKNDFVHLACHGIPNRKQPFESGFALDDGLLKVERIMQYNLQDARFAYLSACHTTVGDKESPDEAIHLAAAMQFAGFRSVIGTMWAVDDAHTNEITSKFYECMLDGASGQLDYTRAARALHKTMNSVSKEIPFDQRILYVHIGA